MSPRSPALNALYEMARVVSDRTQVLVEPAPAADKAVGWFDVDLHPLQGGELLAMGTVERAGRGVADPDRRSSLEGAALQRFDLLVSRDPAPMFDPDAPDERVDRSAVAQFTRAERELGAVRAAALSPPRRTPPQWLERLCERTRAALLIVNDVRASFYNDPNLPNGNANDLELATASVLLDNAISYGVDGVASAAALLQLYRQFIDEAVALVGKAVTGVAKVHIHYQIETFYLFRLLVPFHAISDLGVTAAQRLRVSSELTGLLNNTPGAMVGAASAMGWVSVWLAEKMREIAAAVRAMDPNGDTLAFYLKGGRALALAIGQPQRGENDWDTSIVINPHLPPELWYATFNRVHDMVLDKLRLFKQEFFQLLTGNADSVAAYMASHPIAQPEDSWDALKEVADLFRDPLTEGEGVTASCKAELIDVGMARLSTMEIFEVWDETVPHLMQLDGIPIPGWRYYIDEYVMMIRDAMAGQSTSPSKTAKRIRRLYDVVSSNDPGLGEAISRARGEIAEGIFPRSVSISDVPLAGFRPPEQVALIVVLLSELQEAYDLVDDVHFAAVLDYQLYLMFQNDFGGIPYPPAMDEGIAADIAAGHFDLNVHGFMLQWIALVAKLAELVEAHFRQRAAFFGFGTDVPPAPPQLANRRELEELVRAVIAQSVATPEEELEVVLAISGAAAAWMHADYEELEPALRRDLDPVRFLEVTLYARNGQANPDVVRDAVLAPLVAAYVANPLHPPFVVQPAPGGVLDVYWPNAPNIGAYAYEPLAIRFRVDVDTWPRLAYVWGLPVLSLPDLAREYQHRGAAIQEYARHQIMKRTMNILRSMAARAV